MDSSFKHKSVNPTESDPNKISYHLKKDLTGDKKVYNSLIRYAEKNLFLQRADAEDLVADIYTHLIEIENKGRVLKSSEAHNALLNFLYTCVRNRQKSNLRQLKRKKEVFDDFYKTVRDEDLYEPSPEIKIMKTEQSKKLMESIDALRKPHKTALKQRLDGASYLQISKKEQISMDIANARIHQAKKRLKDKLSSDQFD